MYKYKPTNPRPHLGFQYKPTRLLKSKQNGPEIIAVGKKTRRLRDKELKSFLGTVQRDGGPVAGMTSEARGILL